ncbi:MAG: molybdopterin-dependent oxidoreductase [Gemmatimonadales bacterium]|nr:molybdopterin-dependent oxidoreductase [Gemmatimonadales bacterium]NIN12260.1 molybdopterin-dependent oxidoreductase [Gemmatimonadales bacterium]NIN50662.1 molybdopterin-dependent oxidoreductase [Gemmatimonadales bacterium]NIP08126.1 molybdopterin-dependent oxidoreductase [Gemmatimonadales bacterium]NIR03419.1 molybdopterin-dependent oxidoreductase [Gemmatimonadales bacterium]
MSNPLADMEKPDVIFCIGTNMTECHPVAATRIKRALAKGAKLMVADPRHIGLADLAHLYLPIRVGSDAALLLGMAHVIAREGLTDQQFIAERTTESGAFLEHVEQFPPEWAESITGVPAQDIETAALWYGGAERGAIYYTLGVTEHICGVDNVQSLCNLALMTGNIGREGTGINPMRGQNNIQGAGDSGALPNNYPGFQPVTDPENQAKFKKLWGREVDLEKGITKVTALQLAGDRIRAMLIDGENTLVSDPDRHHCEHALRSLDHLVVIDLFLTETARLADVVLPATAWGETDGVCTNTERRVQRLRAAVPPPGQAKPDWWIVCQIAKRLDLKGFDFPSAKEVFNELCSVSPIYAGLDWDRIEHGQYQWPVPDKDHPGTPVLHKGQFRNGRGIFSIINYRDPAETVSEDYPVWLTTGRRLASYHTRTQTGRSQGIDYLLPEELLEVHPDDVQAWDLEDGGWARMTSSRGCVLVKVQATRRSPRGTVFASFSFANVPVNILTGSGYDPVTHTAELKVCPVRLEPAEEPAASGGS